MESYLAFGVCMQSYLHLLFDQAREEILSVFRHLLVLREYKLLQFEFLLAVPGMKHLKLPNVLTFS